jgi:response regulator NasT
MKLAPKERYMSPRWRVLLVSQRSERASVIEQALTQAAHRIVHKVSLADDLAVSVERAQPDMLVIELADAFPGLLGQLRNVMDRHALPIVVFADESGSDDVRTAVKAGVSAYVVDGLEPQRVMPVLEAAMARFVEFQALRLQRDDAVERLAERRDVERAKGILMRRRDLGEQAAYDTLRKMAMDRGVKIVEVAKNIIAAEELLAKS